MAYYHYVPVYVAVAYDEAYGYDYEASVDYPEPAVRYKASHKYNANRARRSGADPHSWKGQSKRPHQYRA